jgi:hypothetical protein
MIGAFATKAPDLNGSRYCPFVVVPSAKSSGIQIFVRTYKINKKV